MHKRTLHIMLLLLCHIIMQWLWRNCSTLHFRRCGSPPLWIVIQSWLGCHTRVIHRSKRHRETLLSDSGGGQLFNSVPTEWASLTAYDHKIYTPKHRHTHTQDTRDKYHSMKCTPGGYTKTPKICKHNFTATTKKCVSVVLGPGGYVRVQPKPRHFQMNTVKPSTRSLSTGHYLMLHILHQLEWGNRAN